VAVAAVARSVSARRKMIHSGVRRPLRSGLLEIIQKPVGNERGVGIGPAQALVQSASAMWGALRHAIGNGLRVPYGRLIRNSRQSRQGQGAPPLERLLIDRSFFQLVDE
jgi:hypothetical protein